jgi:RNA polymerase sigma-70 factor (ECF subfamily)
MSTTSRQLGDEQRLTAWVRDHGPAVRGYVLGFVRRLDVAEDLTQEVFRRAWQARKRYRETGADRAYLLKIADRLVIDRRRRTRCEITIDPDTWQQVEPASPDNSPELTIVQQERAQELTEALRSLTEPQRRVLLLRYYGQMEFSEIARVMNCPLNTALSHCRRGLLALKKLLAEQLQ